MPALVTDRMRPGAVVSDATRIWELNVHWPLHAQCGIWDPRGKGVDIWECIRPHNSTQDTQGTRRYAVRCASGAVQASSRFRLSLAPLALADPYQPVYGVPGL
ncbi:hypothetical protein EIP91_000047 [Steccherinum ochraceum]|uniref:Uncharacterized protein n=1 Tax=Steccherinum ochraceum TaxID=92696 RepID=A0A4R0RXV6_9APHY|nr:hypothetical protein EIP91_000047 [Steccherinum ochraceum]